MTPRRILVPLDGSPLAESALADAVDIAVRHGATLVLLRAAYATALPAVDPVDAQVSVVREAEAYLADIAARARAAGVKDVETSVWYAAATDAIVEAARMRDVDLIVMSTHGRTGLTRLMLGSVAESVLRSTNTPILMLRAHGAATAAPAAAAPPPGHEVAPV
jgi:nucleotide-binding universal stress UspA family protein